MFQHHKKHHANTRGRQSLTFYESFPLSGKESLETVFSSDSAQRKKPINTFGYSHPHPPPPKTGTTFTCRSICKFFTPSHQLYKSSEERTLGLALWLSGHWSHVCLPPRLSPPLRFPPWALCTLSLLCSEPIVFSFPTPLARPVLFHENGSPINPACTLIDLLTYNSLLHWREEVSFWEFLFF